MDPVSIIGVTAAIQQIIQAVYSYGSSVRSAKSEINTLCSELLALKAALEHIHLNSTTDQLSAGMANLGLAEEAQQILSTSNYTTPEFQQTFANTQQIVHELLQRLQRKPGKLQTAKQGMLWHLVKDDIRRDIDRLNRLRSFFILATTSDNTVVCRESYLKICAIDVRLQKQEDREERELNSKLRQAARQWIAPYEPHHFYQEAIESFQEGTGEWFLNDVFQQWLSNEKQKILWLQARPGSGKTTLLSATIEQAQSLTYSMPHAICLAYFYCSFTDKDSQDIHNLFGSFLAQLCDCNPEHWDEVESHYVKRKGSSKHEPQKLEIEVIRNLIIQFGNQNRRTILFLDALNESKQHPRILSILSSLSRDCPRIRIMLSSTEEVIPNLRPEELTLVSMDSKEIARDISKVVDTRLEGDERLRDLPPALKRDIKTTLERDSDGVFRWAECQLSTLADHSTALEIKRALDNVPLTLEQTYRSVLARIPPAQRHIAQKTLFWVAFALKPMTLKELSEAILISDHSPTATVINDDTRLLRDEILLKACSSLISYSAATTCMTLAHSSVFTYLTSRELLLDPDVSTYHLDAPSAYNAITRRCINYMLLPEFCHGACPNWASLDARFKQWPLLRYVAETLFAHLYYIDLDDEMITLLLHFFRTHSEPHSGSFGTWVQACFPDATHNIEDSTPLYYAARYGLLRIVRMILATKDGKRDLERAGGVYRSTPLHVAAWQGRTEVVAELLRAGANAREVNDEGKPGLLWAVLFGYKEIERMLREAGARLNKKTVDELALEKGKNWQ